MRDRKYSGYRSYSYLSPGDYAAFDMAPELGRVESHAVEVSAGQEARVQRLLDDSLVVSVHDHPAVFPADPDQSVPYIKEGRMVTGYEGLAASPLDCVFDNMMDGTAIITSKMGWKWNDVVHDIGMRLCDLAHQDQVVCARSVDDIIAAREADRIALVLVLESATPIENELERIEILYGLGVRMMGITYSESNALGYGAREPRDAGLSLFGRQAVERMNKVGMVIDVSHSGDQTCLNTIKYSKKPIIISHAGSRTVWDSPRMKPDDVFLACADRGGLIGLEAAPHTSISRDHPQHSIYSVMDHFEYCVELVGIDHVVFGPDTLYGDHVALHNAFRAQLSLGQVSASAEQIEKVPYVTGLENPTECFPNIVRWLVKHNYSDDDIQKVIGGNVMRVLREIW